MKVSAKLFSTQCNHSTQYKGGNNNNITIAKAIGIILMVVGHSGCPKFMHDIIYLFHMPLFFFCSGYFFNYKQSSQELRTFAKKRVFKLYVPYLKWSVAFLAMHNMFLVLNIYNTEFGYEGCGEQIYAIKDYLMHFVSIMISMDGHDTLLGGFWFLKYLFLCSLLCGVVSFFLQRDSVPKTVTLIAVFLLLTLTIRRLDLNKINIWILGDISKITFACVFFMTGNLFKKNKWWIENNTKMTFFICILLFFCLYIKYGAMSFSCGFNKVVPYYIVALSGTVITISVSYLLDRCNLSVMYQIGNNTMIILCLHFICFKIVSLGLLLFYEMDITQLGQYPVIDVGNAFSWIIYSFVGSSCHY